MANCKYEYRKLGWPKAFDVYPKSKDGFPIIPEDEFKAYYNAHPDEFKPLEEQKVADALVGSVKAKDKNNLITIIKRLFNIGHDKGTAVAEVADRMFKQMAKRAGISIEEAYAIVNWKKATAADKKRLIESGNALFQIAGVFDYYKKTQLDPAKTYEQTKSFSNYKDALAAHGKLAQQNVYIRRPNAPKDNSKRVLSVQASSQLILDRMRAQNTNPQAKVFDEYYDNLYTKVPGYDRSIDFMEIPFWIAELSGSIKNDLDAYVMRDPEEFSNFIKQSGYGKVMFSVLDANLASVTKAVHDNPNVQFYLGGYVADLKGKFAAYPNVKTFNSMKEGVTAAGYEYNKQYDYSLFKGSEFIPRLKMSDGCLYKCAFCTVERKITLMPKDGIDAQVKSMGDLNAKLVYLDDKTFGQAENYEYIIEVGDKLAKTNPNFQGFIIQTTSATVKKMSQKDPDFFKKARIQYVEIGIESNNDSVLRGMRKPNSEKLNAEAVQILRANNLKFIPNLIIGFEAETAATYNHTIKFLEDNADIISHANIYNLAIYEGTELDDIMNAKVEEDRNENVLEKSFHSDPKLHERYYYKIFDVVNKIMESHVPAKGPLFQLIGEQGAARLKNAVQVMMDLTIAKKMNEQGANARAIRLLTGWELGTNNKWRYEINPEYSSFDFFKLVLNSKTGKKTTLNQVLDFPELFKAYPDLKKINIEYSDDYTVDASASWIQQKNTIVLYPLAGSPDSRFPDQIDYNTVVRSNLVHELQHIIQEIEGFPVGGSTGHIIMMHMLEKTGFKTRKEAMIAIDALINDINRLKNELKGEYAGFGRGKEILKELNTLNIELDRIRKVDIKLTPEQVFKEYERIAGEVESRNVQKRFLMSDEERLRTLLTDTQDIDEKDLLYIEDAMFAMNQRNPSTTLSQKTGSKIQGAMEFLNDMNQIIYSVTDPNVSTPLHELAHIFEKYLTPAEIAEIESWSGKKQGSRAFSEAFAQGFEKYLMDGKAPVPELQSIFDKFKEWLTAIYRGIKGVPDIQLNDAMTKIYGEMLGVTSGSPVIVKAGLGSELKPINEHIRDLRMRLLTRDAAGSKLAAATRYNNTTVDAVIKEAFTHHITRDNTYSKETDIADKILFNKYRADAAEQLAVGYAILRLQDLRLRNLKTYEKAKIKNDPKADEYLAELENVENLLERMALAMEKSGSEAGLYLRMRQEVLSYKRFDEMGMKRFVMRKLSPEAKLTPEESRQIATMADEIKKMEDEIKDLQAKSYETDEQAREKIADAAVKNMIEAKEIKGKIKRSRSLADARAQLDDVLAGKICD